MANASDPYMNSVTGSDPQNLMEYITRQRIYDSRFWKEECFGLSVVHVVEKAVQRLHCIGGLPCIRFLALTLKLLQLHPDVPEIRETFVEQEDFKYVRALGCMYIRLMGRPHEIYQALEPLYRDYRSLRSYKTPFWSLVHMDEFIHELLTQSTVLGIAMPRLPSRQIVESSGYLQPANEDEREEDFDFSQPVVIRNKIRRPTALHDLLKDFDNDPIKYLQHKAQIENDPNAVTAWERFMQRWDKEGKSMNLVQDHQRTAITIDQTTSERIPEPSSELGTRTSSLEKKFIDDRLEKRKLQDEKTEFDFVDDGDRSPQKTRHKKKKKERNYGNLFKATATSKSTSVKAAPVVTQERLAVQNSDEYWNEQRTKLGIKPLR